jgi:hypothetical protein
MVVLDSKTAPWLLLVFSLPSRQAGPRVEVWRRLRRSGALPLRSAGYTLPGTPGNEEKFQWIAALVRKHKGQASVAQVQSFDDLPEKELKQLFIAARSRDYQALLRDLSKIVALSHARRPAGRLARLRRRFQEIAAIDFYDNPLRTRAEALLAQADRPEETGLRRKGMASRYVKKQWVTRPRPGIDRVSSAWLVRRFIDPHARFVFADDPAAHPEAVPFDMFVEQGFGHRGEDCTFETLVKEFGLRDRKVGRIAQIIHDADLEDEKFGRTEGAGLDVVLKGWAVEGVADEELLRRGMGLIEGLYHGL